jgi:hypothetical protein
VSSKHPIHLLTCPRSQHATVILRILLRLTCLTSCLCRGIRVLARCERSRSRDWGAIARHAISAFVQHRASPPNACTTYRCRRAVCGLRFTYTLRWACTLIRCRRSDPRPRGQRAARMLRQLHAQQVVRPLRQAPGAHPPVRALQRMRCDQRRAALQLDRLVDDLRVRGEIMGPGKYESVGKSQSVLIMINPIIAPGTHTPTHACSKMGHPRAHTWREKDERGREGEGGR